MLPAPKALGRGVTPVRAAATETRASRAQFTGSTVFHGHGKRQIQVEKFLK